MDLDRDSWVIVHVAKGSSFPILVPNICNQKVAQALAAKFQSSGIIILAVCSAGDLADRLSSENP
jgi:hypothetical protein